jgi:hypothetical protein
LGAAGEMPYARLLAEGHGEIWSAAATHIASRTSRWHTARSFPGAALPPSRGRTQGLSRRESSISGSIPALRRPPTD